MAPDPDGRPSAAESTRSGATEAQRLRVAIIYDCLYPHTIGGAERWYRSLAARLAEHHDVTYLTRTQWRPGERPDVPRQVKIVALGKFAPLYTRSGRRRIAPPLKFGLRIFWHLVRNRRRYDVLHTCSFPYFPLLFAAALARLGGPPIVTDWLEVWAPEYWKSYLGKLGGRIGAAMQKLCIEATAQAFTLSESTALALHQCSYRRDPVVLRGIFDNDGLPERRPGGWKPLVVFVGRHIREKNVSVIPQAISLARRQIPELQAIIFGDGPERRRVLDETARLGLERVIDCPGFVEWSTIDAALSLALCLLLPSEREGYGLVVLEAAARGTPAIVVDAPWNAATALVEPGVNGYIAAAPQGPELAAAMVRVYRERAELGRSTRGWFTRHQSEFGLEHSLVQIERAYREATGGARSHKA